MYDNVSQKLKSFTKVLTVILLVLIPAGGITGGILLLLAEAPIGYVIASVLGSAVLALLVYLLMALRSCWNSRRSRPACCGRWRIATSRRCSRRDRSPLRRPIRCGRPVLGRGSRCSRLLHRSRNRVQGRTPMQSRSIAAIRSRVRMFRTRPSIGLRRPMARLRVLTKNSVTNRSADTRRKK